MSFEFTHDGRVFRLDTQGGEVHLQQVSAPAPADAQPLEPSDEVTS